MKAVTNKIMHTGTYILNLLQVVKADTILALIWECVNKCSKLKQPPCYLSVSGCIPLGWSISGAVIQDRSWCIKETDEFTLVPLMHHDLSDFGSLILIQIITKECTLKQPSAYPFWRFWWAPGIMPIIHYSCTGLKGKQRNIQMK